MGFIMDDHKRDLLFSAKDTMNIVHNLRAMVKENLKNIYLIRYGIMGARGGRGGSRTNALYFALYFSKTSLPASYAHLVAIILYTGY